MLPCLAVGKHVGRIFPNLRLGPTTTEHRHVLAVLTTCAAPGAALIAIRTGGIGGRCRRLAVARERLGLVRDGQSDTPLMR